MLRSSVFAFVLLGATLVHVYQSTAQVASQFIVGVMDVENTSTNGGQFTNVAFPTEFSTAPMVFVLTTNEGADSSALRIRNVTSSGFEVAPLEPPGSSATNGAIDGVHAAMTNVSYLAVTPGSGTIGGLKYEAGSVDTNVAVSKNNQTNFADFAFNSTFSSTPALLVDIQTDNDPVQTPLNATSSSPWITAAVESGSISTGGFSAALERAETGDGNLGTNETIGYFAIEQGVSSFADDDKNQVDFASLISGDVITGWTNTGGQDNGTNLGATSGVDVPFGTTFDDTPFVIASLATRDGADGGWLRSGDIDVNSIFLTVDEDKDTDNERQHTDEAASILAFSQTFQVGFVPEPGSIAIWTLIGLGFVGFGVYRIKRKK